MFEVERAETKRPEGRSAAVNKRFRPFDPHPVLLLPPSLDDWLPEGHLARFVADLVDDVLDLSPVLADYTEKLGFPPYNPQLMVRLLIYGYTTGIRSSRAIERRCVDDVAFRFLAADQARTTARSPGSVAATWTHSPTCSSSRCTSRRSSAWSRWAASPWTARSWRRAPPSTRP
jgi:Transposase domain (DUF772)